MPTENKFNFEYSYLSLPAHFYEILAPENLPTPTIKCFNETLVKSLNLPSQAQSYLDFIAEQQVNESAKTFAQAYAGHQFGHFNRLGDGRAIMLGEHLTPEKIRYDLQLKGGGMTMFSRGGDGKATLKSMLREYLMSEAMHALKIPTSRSLAVIQNGEPVYRETVHEGASLIRLMKSHLRVGTFQFAAYLGKEGDVQKLTNYTINRLFPELEASRNPGIALFEKVMQTQIELVASWMSIGFIHGVMNTDNIALSAETFDYGPCAFMNTYHPKTVFSSIDRNARYAYGNQPNIIKWNMMRFAETLLPIIHSEKEQAIAIAEASIQKFDALWNTTYYEKMLHKLGFQENNRKLYPLVDEFLSILESHQMDYTNAFVSLVEEIPAENNPLENKDFSAWHKKWKASIHLYSDEAVAKSIMKANNPMLIPRNHLVEEALDDAVQGKMNAFDTLLFNLVNPYEYKERNGKYTQPPKPQFDKNYQTFCGT